jgi:cytidylate kinase
MIVAIDGPAGSGKSTVAVALARRLGFRYLDTGAMYRALTWLALREGVAIVDGHALAELARAHPVSFGAEGRVEIAGADVTTAIRKPDIDRLVPVVARHPEVREVMRGRQRMLGALGDAVIEGRDIGTVVAPQAEVKVFLVAEEAERARRRAGDRTGVGTETLAADLRTRDEHDAVNTQPAEDAVVLDTTQLTVEHVVERIESLVGEAQDELAR